MRAMLWTGASGNARSTPATPPEVGFKPEEDVKFYTLQLVTDFINTIPLKCFVFHS